MVAAIPRPNKAVQTKKRISLTSWKEPNTTIPTVPTNVMTPKDIITKLKMNFFTLCFLSSAPFEALDK